MAYLYLKNIQKNKSSQIYKLKILHIGPVKNSNKISNISDQAEIADGIGPDGPSRSILGLVDGLSRLDVEVGLLSTKIFNHKSSSLPEKVTFLKPYTGRKYNYFTNSNFWINHIHENFGIPDIVNFHDVYDFFSINIAKKMQKEGWKYFVTPRGGLREYAQKRDKTKKLIANKLFFNSYLENAAFIHALTKEEGFDIVKFNKKLKKQIIIPNGIARNVYRNFEKYKTKKTSNKIKTGFIGQLFPKIKGIDLLLDAIRIYQNKYGDNLEFIFIGPSRSKYDQDIIENYLKKIPFLESLKFKGALYGSDKWKELASFDVFVLPSRTEGMPVVVLEAMAFEKPCLVTSGTNMVNFIEEAQGGWGVNPDPNEISNKLALISKIKKSDLIEIGKKSREYLLNNFTWETVSKDYLKHVSRLLK